MDFMRKIAERYRGIFSFFLGCGFFFLGWQVSSGESVAAAPSTKSDPKIPFFIIGMAIPALLFFTLKRTSPSAKEESKMQTSNLSEDYAGLVEQARSAWNLVSRNNRLYLGSLVVSWGANKFGDLSGHPVFDNSLVIAFVYTLAFFACIQQLVRGRTLDDQIISYAITGIQLEKNHPEWNADYFHKFIRIYQGFEMFSLAFFRVIIPAWLLFSAIDFGVIARFSEFWPKWVVVSISLTTFGLVALFLWRIGCKSYHFLRIRGKEALA